MNKKLIYILATPLLFLLTTCNTLRKTGISGSVGVPLAYFPEVKVPLPEMNLDQITVLSVQDEFDYENTNRVAITEEFTSVDRAEFAVSDPRLFAGDNKLVIDLSKMRRDEYAFPLPGAKLISEYAGKRKRHTGVDLKVSRRDTIQAVFDGIVRISRQNPTYGNVIVVRHYNGLETLYSHNSKNLVRVGERVNAGQPIATTGQTGRASTDHLHFETRINGQHFNPALIFNFETGELNRMSLLCLKQGNKISVNSVDPFPLLSYKNH